MTRQKCGCYDGPYCSETPNILVSVRCPEHSGVNAKPHHSLAEIDKHGRLVYFPITASTPQQKAKATNNKRTNTKGIHG